MGLGPFQPPVIFRPRVTKAKWSTHIGRSLEGIRKNSVKMADSIVVGPCHLRLLNNKIIKWAQIFFIRWDNRIWYLHSRFICWRDMSEMVLLQKVTSSSITKCVFYDFATRKQKISCERGKWYFIGSPFELNILRSAIKLPGWSYSTFFDSFFLEFYVNSRRSQQDFWGLFLKPRD